MAGYEDLIGREDINDLEAILSVANTDTAELHSNPTTNRIQPASPRKAPA